MGVINYKTFFRPSFCLKFVIFFIFIFNVISLFSVNALGILSDKEKVEKLVVDFSNSKVFPRIQLKNLLRYRNQICNMTNKMKLYLCQLYFKEDLLKSFKDINLTWPTQSLKSIKCTKHRYSLQILDEKLLKSNLISMYKCPSTNEGEFLGELPLIYLSNSFYKNAALVFIRQNQFSPLYPHRIIDGFTRRQLKFYGNNFLKRVDKTSYFQMHPSSWGTMVRDRKTLEQTAFNVLKWKKLPAYQKFFKFYDIVSICSLSNIQKLNLCKLMKNKYSYDGLIEFEENQTLPCKNRTITYKTEPEISGLEKQLVALVRCPAIAEPFDDKKYQKVPKPFLPYQFFISKCPLSDCILVYQFLPSTYKNEIKIDFLIMDFQKKVMRENLSMTKKLTANAIVLKEKPMAFSKKLSFKLPDYRRAYQLDSSLIKTEEEVKTLFEVVNLTMPYKKFRKTIRKLNVCQLQWEKKIELCATTFGNQMYGYKINSKTKQPIHCRRLKVILNQHEGRQDLVLIRCPAVVEWDIEGLYLSGGVKEKTAVMYSRNKFSSTADPITLAPNVPI